MSWDIYMIRTKTNLESLDQIQYLDVLKFEKKEVVQELESLSREMNLMIEGMDTRYVYLRGNEWSIEFDFGEDKEPYYNIDMEVRGMHEPTVILNRLKKDLKTRIVDMSIGTFWEDEKSGFSDWSKLNERIESVYTRENQ